ncbi:hypothetical protein Ancab_006376 [Ancistrocladus abbreviatus]
MLFSADPVVMQYTSSTNFSNFHRGASSKDTFDVLGEATFNMEGHEWAKRRKIARHCFSLKEFTEFSNKTTFDLQEVFQRWSFDLTCKTGLGLDPQTLSPQWPKMPWLIAIEDLGEILAWHVVTHERICKVQRWLGVGKERKIKTAMEILLDFAAQQLLRGYEDVTVGTRECYSLGMTYMLEDTIKDEVKKVELIGFLLAGKGTVSATLTWFFWLLFENPSVEAKIRQELKILTSVWGQDSMEFMPERWITENGELKREPAYKFCVFNAGPRICLGKDLAFMEAKAATTTILHNYNVNVSKGQDTSTNHSLVLNMKNGLHATINKRWS